MILQIKTEKELIQMVEALQKEVGQLKAMVKKPVDTPAADIIGIIKQHIPRPTKPELTEQEVVSLIKKNMTKPATPPAFSDSDFLAMRDKHVTIDFINRLYKKGGK